jgi:hypothetical protein
MSPFDSRLWFSDAIRYFRGFGFFAFYPGSDKELAEVIQSYWRGDWDEFLAGISDSPSADQLLLVADTKRVWWHDLEGVYRGANYYANVLNEWATISRGKFTSEQIQEIWQGENGSVEVTFTFNSNTYTFVHRSGDFLEHGILQLINQTLAHTPFHYEVANDYGDSNWIAVLNQNEKQRLKMERGWHFLW